MKLALLLSAFSLLIAGCSSVSAPEHGARAIILDKEQVCHYYGHSYTITFPAGRYQPTFQTERGSYYIAPTAMIQHAALGTGQAFGGLFVPGPSDPKHRQGFWLLTTGSTYFRLTEEVKFRYAP